MKLDATKKYTIKDIAELAGVSKGTVDRVLHKRGKVSQKALEKVNEILKKIDYQPNPIARNLKNNKLYKISILIPNPEEDEYWEKAYEGITTAAKEFSSFGTQVTPFFYQLNNQESFIDASNMALKNKPDGLLMVPNSKKESLKILDKCKNENIVLASFNNVIDGLHNENFIGQNLFQTGRVAANLVHKVSKHNKNIGIIHIDIEPHMKEKENGFIDYFTSKKNDFTVTTINFSTKNATQFKNDIIAFFSKEEAPSTIFVTNSKAYLVIDILSQLSKKIVIVCYDLLNANIKYIQEEKIDFLIHQNPKRQAYLGVYFLAEYFLFDKEIPSQKLLPIDIVTSENLKYYLD